MDENLLLQCNDYEAKFKEMFYNLKKKKEFADVTLACQDGQIPAHQVVLSSNSKVLHNILKSHQHPKPFLYLMGINKRYLNLLLDFIYHGEVEVRSEDLTQFLAIAEELQVQGLSGINTTKKICNGVKKQDTDFVVKDEPNFVDDLCEDNLKLDMDINTNDCDWEMERNSKNKNSNIKKCIQRVVKKNKRSTGGRLLRNPVWDYFDKEENKSTCNQCGSSLLGYNTTSLVNHLRYKHIEVHMEYKEKFEIAWSEKKSCEELVDKHEKTTNDIPDSDDNDDFDDALSDTVQGHFAKTEFEREFKCRHCNFIVVSENSSELEGHLEEKHSEILHFDKSAGSPGKPCRKQGRLSYNPVHEFYLRVDENSQCNVCQFILMGHNPNSLKKHLESHPEQFLRFSEMYQLAWKEKMNQMKEKGIKMKRTPIKPVERKVQNEYVVGHAMDDETAHEHQQCCDEQTEIDVEKEENKEEKMLFCDQCEYETRWHGALKKHIESKHVGVTHKCDICYKKFNLVSSMNYHIRSEHEGRRFHCEICSKEFKCMSHLTQHQRAIHQGVKYPCPHCDYQATQNYNLSKHILKVHGISTNTEIMKI